jgi:hypothetical protein
MWWLTEPHSQNLDTLAAGNNAFFGAGVLGVSTTLGVRIGSVAGVTIRGLDRVVAGSSPVDKVIMIKVCLTLRQNKLECLFLSI